MSTECVMCTMWVWAHGHLETTFKMVHSEGCINLFPVKQTGKFSGNKCITTRYQHVNMFIARNSYEVAILIYVERDG